ncbi:MAG: hypothetical protein ISR39_16365 [Akkermansiaceae bacterium]|nr:hypothetical protein [Akkermansiaceae bacterium]
MKKLLTSSILLGLIAPSQATVIGIETFDTDGFIAAQTGGTGFNYDNIIGIATTTTSDWDNVGSSPSVVGGALVTNDSSAKREYNGNIEGSAGGDGPNTERAGAVRGGGIVFYSVEITRSANAVWSGISGYDFGNEKLFFGVPGSGAATDTLGIGESGVGDTLGSVSLVDGVNHTLVAVIDFDNDLAGLFLDPDGSADFWNVTDGTNSADVTRAYTSTNWNTAARLGSGGETTWDNLTIGINDPTDVGILATQPIPVPEPTSGLLGCLAMLLFLKRRR